MKKFIIPFLALAALAQPAAAEDTVFYCVEEMSTGFYKDKENGKWKSVEFIEARYSIKVKDDWKSMSHEGFHFKCHKDDLVSRGNYTATCKAFDGWLGSTFKIDLRSLRYVFAQPSSSAYIRGYQGFDTDRISVGKCESF